jgi:putative ABC transport system ATP-binding protein
MPLVEIADLSFAWSGYPPCLEIDRFTLDGGEAVFLHGPSGSGKSTLLALLAGVHVARTGRLSLAGTELAKLAAPARDRYRADHVGIVFQQFNLLPYLSVIDNVMLPCRFSTQRRRRALEEDGDLEHAAGRLLSSLDLAAALWTRPAAALSVGQQQRVAVARALIGRPALILADEPTSALDAARQGAFLDLLMQQCAQAGVGLVFASHDLRLAQRFGRIEDMTRLNRVAGGT